MENLFRVFRNSNLVVLFLLWIIIVSQSCREYSINLIVHFTLYGSYASITQECTMIAFCDKNREKEMAETQINKVIFKWFFISYEDLCAKAF